MAQERNNTGESLVAYKSISLVSAEVAQRLGLESEVPIFISPRTISKEICAECGQHYGPLLYQTNYVTQAQHFHDRNGGVYHWAHKGPPIYDGGFWIALIQPQGITAIATGRDAGHGVIHRSEKVLVQAIKAYCIGDHRQELVQGFACSLTKTPRVDLFPVCQKHFNELDHDVKYLFSINDGFVQFSHQ